MAAPAGFVVQHGAGAPGVTDKRTLTASSAKAFRACPRRYYYAYVAARRPREEAAALRFGTAFHRCVEAYWLARKAGLPHPGAAALDRLDGPGALEDPYERVRLEVMARAYAAYWDLVAAEVVFVEAPFRFELRHPKTGEVSGYWEMAGKMDLVLRLADGRIAVGEHKTSSADVGPGSDYRRRLTLDEQISIYEDAARRLGFEPDVLIYDVARKPKQRPLEATPVPKRRFKKDGTLVKTQRAEAETPDAYRERLVKAVVKDPGAVVERIEVHRFAKERRAFSFNLWMQARLVQLAETEGLYSRNSDACLVYRGAPCPYLPVCEGVARIDDPLRYRKIADAHPELAPEV